MSTEPRSAHLPKLVLLILALSGWCAFAAAYFGMTQAQARAEEAEATTREVQQLFEEMLKAKDSTIRLLEIRARQKGQP